MFLARLCFEDGEMADVNLQARPLVGEFVVYEGDRYRVKDVSHIAVAIDSTESAILELKLGMGHNGSHRHALESSPRWFFTVME
jgi:hypothetical protein